MKRIKTCSKRLVVRNLKIADYPLWLHNYKNRGPAANPFDSGPAADAELSKRAYQLKLKRWRERSRLDGFTALGIFNRKETILYGVLDIHFLNLELRWANLGFEISNNYWGRGIATEAARLGLAIAFDRLHAHRVEVGCNPENLASHAVIRKLALNYEGIRKNLFPDELSDLVVYAISRPEYIQTVR